MEDKWWFPKSMITTELGTQQFQGTEGSITIKLGYFALNNI